jgi:hypothetical protein
MRSNADVAERVAEAAQKDAIVGGCESVPPDLKAAMDGMSALGQNGHDIRELGCPRLTPESGHSAATCPLRARGADHLRQLGRGHTPLAITSRVR